MAGKRFDKSQPVEPPNSDDLKLINGIGRVVENRLHERSVYTFAQLSALSPADIAAAVADVAGLTAERIIKQDWIGQARRLAALQKEAEQPQGTKTEPAPPVAQESGFSPAIPEEAALAPAVLPEPASVIPEVADDIAPVADEQESGSVFVQKEVSTPATVAEVELSPVRSEQVGPALTIITEQEIETQAVILAADAGIGSSGVLRLSKMDMIQGDLLEWQGGIRQDEPFRIDITLDLIEVVLPATTVFDYKAYIHSRSLEGFVRQLVGEASGRITSADSISIHVKPTTLPKGACVLQALVTLWPEKTGNTPPTYLQARSDRRLIMVI
jgi:hypothetical protein